MLQIHKINRNFVGVISLFLLSTTYCHGYANVQFEPFYASKDCLTIANIHSNANILQYIYNFTELVHSPYLFSSRTQLILSSNFLNRVAEQNDLPMPFAPPAASLNLASDIKIDYFIEILLFITTIMAIIMKSLRPKIHRSPIKIKFPHFKSQKVYSMLPQENIYSPPNTVAAIEVVARDEQITRALDEGCKLLNMDVGLIVEINNALDLVTFDHVYSRQQFQFTIGQKIHLNNTIFAQLQLQETNFHLQSNIVSATGLHNYRCDHVVRACYSAKLYRNKSFYGLVCFLGYDRSNKATTHGTESFQLLCKWINDLIYCKEQFKTLEKQKNEALATNSSKSTFLANMSHELRTPLTAIIGYSDMLVEDLKDTHQTQSVEDLHKIQTASNHLLKVINNILDLSKIEAGKLDVNLNTFNLNFLIQDILELSQTLAQKNNNQLFSNLPIQPIDLRSDETLLRQSVLNIIGNACKFTQNGKISIDVTEHRIASILGSDQHAVQRWFYISIKDTGIGISDIAINKLFKEFSQVDRTSNTEYGGTGLGLAISYRMCQLLGGDIIVESKKNKGSTFTIKIPDLTENSSLVE